MGAHEERGKLAPLGRVKRDLMKEFVSFNSAVMADGALSVKNKELIAVAVALTIQCEYSLTIHSEEARKAGATDDELAEAAFVVATIRAGGAITHAANRVMLGDCI